MASTWARVRVEEWEEWEEGRRVEAAEGLEDECCCCCWSSSTAAADRTGLGELRGVGDPERGGGACALTLSSSSSSSSSSLDSSSSSFKEVLSLVLTENSLRDQLKLVSKKEAIL